MNGSCDSELPQAKLGRRKQSSPPSKIPSPCYLLPSCLATARAAIIILTLSE